jgi:hypothetical protein
VLESVLGSAPGSVQESAEALGPVFVLGLEQ